MKQLTRCKLKHNHRTHTWLYQAWVSQMAMSERAKEKQTAAGRQLSDTGAEYTKPILSMTLTIKT